MEFACPAQKATFEHLERVAPGVPLLALGQTVFWDEPLKAGVALGLIRHDIGREFYAGIHDTDYFAKMPRGGPGQGYQAFPHNDTTTRGLWSAAGEFSSLFGSETVVSREMLQAAGLKLAKIERERPGVLDSATEAFGWRGIAALGQDTRVTAETPLGPLFATLMSTLDWATDETVGRISGDEATAKADELRSLVCEAGDKYETKSLSEFYAALLPQVYGFVAGRQVPITPTRTTKLLRFNKETAGQRRFELVDRFLRPESRLAARTAYDEVVQGTEVYTLDRFGSWAIPFDLVVPGHGRGTLRIAPKAVIVMTPQPLFITTKKPVASIQDLAEAVERKFGADCTLVGKAITLIGMLAREFVFVFHEGASSYVTQSRALHQRLEMTDVHPILRVRYDAWSSLKSCETWLKVPEPMRDPFGAEELCGPSFASRWKSVAAEQKELLKQLGELRRPLELIRFLAKRGWGSWNELAVTYEGLHDQLAKLNEQIGAIREEKQVALNKIREAVADRLRAEEAMGAHWRARIFDKEHTAEDLAERQRLALAVHAAITKRENLKKQFKDLQIKQTEVVRSAATLKAHQARKNLELEAELKRLRLARHAIITSKGLERASRRPSAWWFPMVSPDGAWFRETTCHADYYVEPLA